jgi:hypothetical protein
MRATFAMPMLCSLGLVTAPWALHADCTTDLPINASVLSGQIVCAFRPGSGGTDPNRRWSEIHNAATDGGGMVTLGEHGRGSNDPAGSYDPNIGTWEYSGSIVTYDYSADPGSPYIFTLHGTDPSTPTSLCDGATESATISAVVPIGSSTANNPCGWAP